MEKMCIISLGGSLLVPEEVDSAYIRDFVQMIRRFVAQEWKFVIIVGGGRTARKYIAAAHEANNAVSDEDKDWLGIHATRLNAHLLRTVLRDVAHPRINTNPHDLEDFYGMREPVMIAAGWRPGFSTDYDAVVLAKYLDIDKIVNFSNIEYVYDKDPKHHSDAKKLPALDWAEFRALVGDTWSPGLNAPFDPVASKLAQEANLKVTILNGKNLENFEAYLEKKPFTGTVIGSDRRNI